MDYNRIMGNAVEVLTGFGIDLLAGAAILVIGL